MSSPGKLQLAFLLLIHCLATWSQQVINYEVPVEGNIFLTPDIAIPKVNNGYTVWLPDSGQTRGLVVFIHARRDTVNSEPIIDYALEKQLGVL